MISSSAPAKISVPFANVGTKNTIPVASQIGITAGAASFTTGFPPLTFTPLASGGVPPFGADFNGVLNSITAIQQFQGAGGVFPYDATFSTAIGGYPKGCLLANAAGTGFWVSTVESNTSNPDTGGANWSALATSALVQQALGNLQTVNAIAGTTTLTAAKAGMLNRATGAGYTITLPAASAVISGSTYHFNSQSAGVTIACAGSDLMRFSASPSSLATVVLAGGDTLSLSSNGSANWIFAGGSAGQQYSTSWTRIINGSTGTYQKFPSGLIMQWVTGAAYNTETSEVVTLPLTFPTGIISAQVSTLAPSASSATDAMFQIVSMNTSSVTVFRQGFSGTTDMLSPIIYAVGY